jgi:hypothetical protein
MMLLARRPTKLRVNRTLMYGSIVGACGKRVGTAANSSACPFRDVTTR